MEQGASSPDSRYEGPRGSLEPGGLVVPAAPDLAHAHLRHRPRNLELADIVREHGQKLQSLTTEQGRALTAIVSCRTNLLGGHLLECDTCSRQEISYNSCRNRSCPKCQSLPELRWVEARQRDLLPVEYHHAVFTIPDTLHPFFRADPRVAYALLFSATSETLTEVAHNPKRLGAEIGFLAVLHTWTQTLLYHPHIHCIIPGGGLSFDRSGWVSCRKGFFLPVRVLAEVFRGKLLSKLEMALAKEEIQPPQNHDPARLLKEAARKKWCVYSKPSFAGPDHVIRYLGRYAHRIAISEERLVSMKDDQVTFSYKDRADGDRKKFMTLPAEEFLRRFVQHVLPSGFVRLRYYGFLANSARGRLLPLCRQLLGAPESSRQAPESKEPWQQIVMRHTGRDVTLCQGCRKGHMVEICEIPRAPPGSATPRSNAFT